MKTVNKEIIKEFEGLRLEAYKCPADVWTIGYGHTRAVVPGDVITEKEAEDFLSEDVEDAEDAVNAYVDVKLNQNQFDALVSFVYNLGAGNFRSSTLLRKLNAGDYLGAANEFKRWNKSGGVTLNGLVRRREAEANLFIGAYYE
ncbi:lysozyme [Shewanella chilikensis]|uniref:lysozyme n=1 Tax=Shewanella chilikensis TaxID=558541 RepID=UPI003A9747BE